MGSRAPRDSRTLSSRSDEESVIITKRSLDRRRATRRPLVTRVAVKTDKAIFFMESKDISETGIRVVSEVGIPEGTRLVLVPFFDDVARLFETRGTVVRSAEVADGRASRPSDATQADMGIQFDVLGQEEMAALLGILRLADLPNTAAQLRA
jgi:hypothetical protein